MGPGDNFVHKPPSLWTKKMGEQACPACRALILRRRQQRAQAPVGPGLYSSSMDVFLTLAAALGAALLTGIAVYFFVRGSTVPPGAAELSRIERLTAENQGLQRQLQLVTDNAETRIGEYRQMLTSAQAELRVQRQEFDSHLAGLASVREKELKEQSRKLQEEEAQEGRVLAALAPVADNLQALQTRLNRLEEQRHQQFGTLSEQLKSAQETDQQLQSITRSLESALRNTSVRGSWGEQQLVNIVEASGLTKQVDFLSQVTTRTEDGHVRPDMVIRLPGGKALPVDAKVPFDSFIRANDLGAKLTAEQDRLRQDLLAQHVKALRTHVDDLAARDYGRWVPGSPDFTIAFIPSESLLSAALETDPALLDYAFRKRVALASPVTLWSVLKTVSFAWQQEALSQEAQDVFVLARELSSRLATLGGHVTGLGANLARAVESYNAFIGSLERRVLVSARKFQKLDEDTVIAKLTPVDAVPRPLTDPDMSPRPHPEIGSPDDPATVT